MGTKPLIPTIRVAADSVAFIGAFGAAYALRQWEPIQALRFPIQSLDFYLPLLPVAVLLLLGSFWRQGLYDPTKAPANLAAIVNVVRGTALWLVSLMAAFYLAHTDPSRALLLLSTALTLVAVITFRSLLQRMEQQRDIPVRQILTIDRALTREMTLSHVVAAGGSGTRFRVAADLFPLLRSDGWLPDFGDDSVVLDLGLAERGFWPRFGKWPADVLLSLACLPVAIPAGLAISAAIFLDSGSPVLFSHERIGRHGKPFRMLKFRTMVADTPALADAPRTPNDARVTRVGRWLRRWSLDELPQFWNVLQGEMSLVGPRPEMPHLVAQYAPWQRMRFLVRPGLTGLWQVLGRKEFPLHEHLEYDVYYVNNVSISLDLAILLKTLPRIIGGRGAY